MKTRRQGCHDVEAGDGSPEFPNHNPSPLLHLSPLGPLEGSIRITLPDQHCIPLWPRGQNQDKCNPRLIRAQRCRFSAQIIGSRPRTHLISNPGLGFGGGLLLHLLPSNAVTFFLSFLHVLPADGRKATRSRALCDTLPSLPSLVANCRSRLNPQIRSCETLSIDLAHGKPTAPGVLEPPRLQPGRSGELSPVVTTCPSPTVPRVPT